ncbi:MAG: type II toxin-antitoxin system VapB family antitoxin [Leptospiraceae bacterium]|nr:AbrB/MazE/SpoVT family DNA-binding domain-containing protein [Leptospiraceae bacterium]MCK6380773.1 type II toxin-antitoxin system VapB family antitoxin [Leptospiraceae bacterium]NUM41624.1 AbrB/MazE/SpoVT family DNA-binding domain-containing protein [Leptospiraceae bacterium]
MNRAKLFKNGESQAIRLPKQFRFKGKEVYIRKDGNNVVLSPIDDAVDRIWKILFDFSNNLNVERSQPKDFDKREIF